MKEYELIREIYNSCSNNSNRDRFISELETDDLDAVARSYCVGNEIKCERSERSDGAIVYDIVTDGLQQRLTFSEI